MLKRLPRCPSKHVLFSFLLIVGALVCCLIPGVARADTVTRVNNSDELLNSVGGDVYITNPPSAANGQYWDGGSWRNVTSIPKNGSSVSLGNGWRMFWWSGKWGGNYAVWRNEPVTWDGTTFRGFKMRFNDIGYTKTGEHVDVVFDFTKIYVWRYEVKELTWYTPFEITTDYGIQLAAEGEKSLNPGISSTYTTRFVKRGTDQLIDASNEVDLLYWDIDQPAPKTRDQDIKTIFKEPYIGTTDWRESIWKVSGYKEEAITLKDAWLEIKANEAGIPNAAFLSKKSDEGNSGARVNHSLVVLKSAPEFVTQWRGWSCSTGMGFDTVVQAYPKWSDPVKDPPTQVKKRGEVVEFNVKQTFPFVTDNNKAKSIVMTDTLDPALDASKAEVKVYKGADDVTDNWTISVNGQTVTATAKNTGHGHVEGEHTFKIRVPVSETADLSSYEQQDDQGNKFWKVPNQASVAINGTAKTTNTTHVLVPYEASGSVQISAKKSLKGKQLEDQQFTFRLTDGRDAVVGEKKNDGTGDVTFDTIDFDQDDIGKTYTYTITELDDAKQGYTYDAHTETVKVKVEDAGGGKLNVVSEYDADGAQFENSYAPNVGFAILKHDENDQPLGGAKFTLYLDDGDNKFTSMDSPATIYEDQTLQRRIEGAVMTTDGQGKALCYGLDWGKTYWLKETTAPAGYTLDPDAHRVVVGEDGSISLVDEQGVLAKLPVKDGVSTMTIKDTRVASLPSTAGTGITPILFVGFALVLVGGGSILHVVRRRRYL